MFRPKLIALLIISIALLITPQATDAKPVFQQPTAAFEPVPCMFEFPILSFMPPESSGYECGYVTVPENHANPDGPAIRLPVAIHRTTSETPQPDPLFMAQGGPGGDAFDVFSLEMAGSPLAQERDIVIFNQRGARYTEPNLLCSELFDARPEILPLPPEESLQREKELLAQCRQRLQSEGVNLSAYNSLENAADVEAIRAALGYDQINFYGVSYGTLLALHLMRHYPEHLRSVIIDGVVPTHLNFITQVAQAKERIFSQMFQSCANDPTCQANYPQLEAQFFALVERLNEQPASVPLTDPDSGETVAARLDGDGLIDLMFQIFYLADAYAIFPKLVTDIETGDYSFLQAIWPLLAFDRTMSDGMYFSVVCAEDADFDPNDVPLDGVRPQFAAAAPGELQEYLDVCSFWQVDQLPSSVDEPVISLIPTLLLSGQFDPITPPAFGAAAAEYLANSYHVVSPVSSHGTFGSHPCIDQITQDFLDNPYLEPNTACLDTLAPSDFVSKNVIRVGLVWELLGELKTEALIQTGLAGLLLAGVLSAFVVWPLAWLVNLLRHQKTTYTAAQKRLRLFSAALVILFGLLSILFVVGLTSVSLYAIIANTNLLVLSSLPGWSAPLFVIPWLLAALALGLLVVAVLVWRKGGWSIWGRLYYTLLTLSAAGYVIMLAVTGMFSVLI